MSTGPIHRTIYRETGRFAGWPANYGIWSWENEIVVGFVVGRHQVDGGFHARDRRSPFTAMQARSQDGGLTWEVRPTPCRPPGGYGLSAIEHMDVDLVDTERINADLHGSPGGIDFSHPDFALMCGRTGLKAGARSFFYTSSDRCRSWRGPHVLPSFGTPGVAARTDYLVEDPDTCTIFLTAAKRTGGEGRAFCARTRDGGGSFEFLSWIGPEPEGFTIMPASVRLPDSRILVALRCRGASSDGTSAENWIDLYESEDNGTSWRHLARPVDRTGAGGNPPAFAQLPDGRLCLVYGYRDPPFGVYARLSEDSGRSWSDALVLREDAGGHDIGYPRVVSTPDRTVLAVYYWHDEPDSERYIAVSRLRP